MRMAANFLAMMSFLVVIPSMVSNASADEIRQGDTVTIVTPGTVARLCPHPGCGENQHITRIPEATTLEVQGIKDFMIGTFTVKWFEVIYEGNRGWISIYDTDKAQR